MWILHLDSPPYSVHQGTLPLGGEEMVRIQDESGQVQQEDPPTQ
jgi:hypothetical protein